MVIHCNVYMYVNSEYDFGGLLLPQTFHWNGRSPDCIQQRVAQPPFCKNTVSTNIKHCIGTFVQGAYMPCLRTLTFITFYNKHYIGTAVHQSVYVHSNHSSV